MVCLALATPGAKTCDAEGGALRSQRRSGQGRIIGNLVRVGGLANAVCKICITSQLPVARVESGTPASRSHSLVIFINADETRNLAFFHLLDCQSSPAEKCCLGLALVEYSCGIT